MSTAEVFPFPIPEYGAEPYWAACNDRRLNMQRCASCEQWRWEPAPLCPQCGNDNCTWETLSGRGTITTWTEISHPVHPAAVSRVPYVVAEIELDEQKGLRMISNIIDTDAAKLRIGAPVLLDFVAHANGQLLPVFRLA